MLSLLVALSTLLSSAHTLAIPQLHGPTSHEQLDSLPAGWERVGDSRKDASLTLRAYLSQDQGVFARIAQEVSDPSSIHFGKHLSAEELASTLPSLQHASSLVTQWLDLNDISEYQAHREFIEFTTTVDKAETMLMATFDSYVEDHPLAVPVLRTQSYSLPQEVRPHIDFIYPTVHFFQSESKAPIKAISRRQHIPTGPADCSSSVCPAQLRKQYNISYRPEDNTSGSKIGVAGFLGNFPNITSVKGFVTDYGDVKDAVFPHYEAVSVNQGTTDIPPDSGALTSEAEMDLDYMIVFTGPLDASFYSVGGPAPQLDRPGNDNITPLNEPYLEFLQYIVALTSPPQVISISYSDDEQTVPLAYARRVCDLFAQAASRGISVIVASGDGGASGTGGDTSCKSTNGEKRFVPTFPASCPWVTSVGATAGYGGAASFSSGGMSNYFPRPSWQDQNVTAYINALNGSHAGFYNDTGRAIPDISLLGDDYLTLGAGYPSVHDGTSASAPVFAAMIALINDIRLRAKKPALGFLNPLLYASGAAGVYTDIADGSASIGCADADSFETGWPALEGWDAATGLGEPDFEKLRNLLA